MELTLPQESDVRAKARALVEALPYISRFRGHDVVVKIGGAALEDAHLAGLVAEDIALMSYIGIRVVLVHGGGPQVSGAMREMGLSPRFIDGLRVTDDATMEVMRRIVLGSINPTLVERLGGLGVRAVGLSGTDGGILCAERVGGSQGQELGRVGRVSAVDDRLIASLLDSGYLPVIASVAPARDGTALNINADAVAGALAGAMRAVKLIYLTNVEGLYRNLSAGGSVISELRLEDLRALVHELSEGMRPKAASAVAALEAGVSKVHILDGRVEHALLVEIFTDEGIGTQVLP